MKKISFIAVFFVLLIAPPLINFAGADSKTGTIDNPTVKKEKKEITSADYGDSFQIIGRQNIDTRMQIVDKLLQVKNKSLDPESFFKEVSALEMPEGKQLRNVLMEIKKDIGNHLGRNGIEAVFGTIYKSESTFVESKVLGHRAEAVKSMVMETIRQTAKTNPAFSAFYSEVGGWATESPKEMKFAGDIDFNFLSGNLDEAMKLKQIYDGIVSKRYGRTPEELDIPCTVHGMGTGEVYIGKSGQSYAETVTKKVKPISFGENKDKIGFKKEMDFKEALDIMILEGTLSKTPLPDLEELQWKQQPALSYEMARHFEHDIMRTDAYSSLESFVKAAKYLDRSFTAVENDKGKSSVKDKKLRTLVNDLVKEKKSPKAQVEILKQYFGGELPYGAKLELNAEGKGKAEIQADQKLVKEFWDTCNKALWENANSKLKEVSKEFKNRARSIKKSDPQQAKALYDELNKYVEMMEMEDRILNDQKAGLGERLEQEYKANMAEFRDVVKEFKQNAAKSDLLKVIEPAKADAYKFIDQQLKINTPSSLRLAAVAMIQAPGKVNDILDFIDDGLLNEFRYGETKEFDTHLRKGRNLSWNEQADQFLKGTGLEGHHSETLGQWEAGGKQLVGDASVWMNKKLESLCGKRGIRVIKSVAGTAGGAGSYVSGGIKKINNTFSQSVAASRGGQAMMSGMMIYNLSQEVPLYVNLVANGDMEGLATEFFKRRVPFGGAVEKAVMGDYLGVAWEVTATVLPPASLLAAAKSIGETIGHESWDIYWSSELDSFIDNLYDTAQFRAASVETTGDNIKISQWELISVTHRGKTYQINDLIQSEIDGAREMAECLNQPSQKRAACFPMEKVNDGIFEWWKTSTAFQEAFKKSDPWIQLITEMSNAPHVGKKLKDHFFYQKETRWEQLKVEFLKDVKRRLEDRRAGEQTLLSGAFIKMHEELVLIAGKLDIRPQVEKALNDEFGGAVSEAIDYVKDLLKGVYREATGDVDIWDRSEEMAAYVTSAARTYKTIWDGRKTAEQNMPEPHRDQGLRILTGPYFLSGIHTEDAGAADPWFSYPARSREEMIETLIDIKLDGEIDPPHLNLEEGDYDLQVLEQLVVHDTFREMWKQVNSIMVSIEPPISSYLGKDEASQAAPHIEEGISDQDRAQDRFKHHIKRMDELKNEFRAHYGIAKEDELSELRILRDQAVSLASQVCSNCAVATANLETMTSSIDEIQNSLAELEKSVKTAGKTAKDLESIEATLAADHESAEGLAGIIGDGNVTAGDNRETVCEAAAAMQECKTNSERDRLYGNAIAAHSLIKPAFETARSEFSTLEGIGDRAKEISAKLSEGQQAADFKVPDAIITAHDSVKSNLASAETLLTAETDAALEQLTDIIKQSKEAYQTAKARLKTKRKTPEGAALWEEMKSLSGQINAQKKVAAGCRKEPEANFKQQRAKGDSFINRYTALETTLNRIHNAFLPDDEDNPNPLLASALEKINLIDLLVSMGEGYIKSCIKQMLVAKNCMNTADQLSNIDLSTVMPGIVGMYCKEGRDAVAAKNINYQIVSGGQAAHPDWEYKVESTDPPGGSEVSLTETVAVISCYEDLNIPAYLATINCSHVQGSTAVYNEGLRKGVCDCINGAVFNPSRTRCINCRGYHNGFVNAFNAGNLEDAQAWVDESRACDWAPRAQAQIKAEYQRRACMKISAELHAACKANQPHAVSGLLGEAQKWQCSIHPELWQWAVNIIEAYNDNVQRQAEQRNRDRQRQQQVYNSVMEMMNQAIKNSNGSGGSSRPETNRQNPNRNGSSSSSSNQNNRNSTSNNDCKNGINLIGECAEAAESTFD